MGAAFSAVKRITRAYYQGPNGEPRILAKSGRKLPSPRVISLQCHRPKPSKTVFSLMLMQFGQLLDHDVTLLPVATESDDTIKCCFVPPDKRPKECFPIENPHNDHSFASCSEFVRSEPMTFINGTIAHPRQHLNAITVWLDGSSFYGNDRERAAELRTHNGTGALLKTSLFKGKEMLPEGHDDDCINLRKDHFCATAGDDRVNEHPGLTSIHLLFHREHNRLVRKLAKALLYRQGSQYSPFHVNQYIERAPKKLKERLYQVVRKVMGAVWQKLVYDEYLPIIVGPDLMTKFQLWTGWYVQRDDYLEPGVYMEFLTAAFRYGHTLVNDQIQTDKLHFLREVFSTSSHTLNNYRNIIKGLISAGNHAESFDNNIAPSLVDHLFQNTADDMIGMDLAAMNVQRGRDHAIPTYNEMREYLHLKPKKQWKDFGECGKRLKRVYEHPDDVELFTGGTCEKSVYGGVVGETFGHILGIQFQDLKFSDRFYYETEDSFYGFKRNELRAINRYMFSKILCENADLEYIQRDPFFHPHDRINPTYKCSDYRDLDMWRFTYYVK